jgi:hypothetical protein
MAMLKALLYGTGFIKNKEEKLPSISRIYKK